MTKKRFLYTWLLSCALTGFGATARAQVITDLPGLGAEPASPAYIKASNSGAYEHFGEAVAISADGSTLAVAAIFEDSRSTGVNGDQNDFSAPNAGAVYVFARSGDGWVQQAYIKASNTEAADRFGRTVSLSYDGNTLAVGAMSEDSSATGIGGDQNDNSIGNAGAVYIFARQGGEWSQQAYIKASNTGGELDGDQFGHDVGLSGDGNTLAVGAISEDSAATGVDGDQNDNSLADQGAVYVFTRNGTAWSQQAYIKSDGRPPGQTFQGLLFGYSVGLDESGDTLAIGAYNEDGNEGSIYVFARSADRWTRQSRLTASNAERGDALGTDVAISADGLTIAGGAFDEDSLLVGTSPGNQGGNDQPTDTGIGAVYVFVKNDGEWSQQAFVKPTHAQTNQHFGWALALSADASTLLVGAHFEDSAARGVNGEQQDASAEDAGAAYLYRRNGAQWAPIAYLKASNTHEHAEFATSVSLNADGNLVVIGAPRESSGATGIGGEQNDLSAPESGAVYIY